MTDLRIKQDFLAAAGWRGATIEPLAGDASARRYDRIRHADGHTAMLMDAPRSRGEKVHPFMSLTYWLRDLGLSAPEIYHADPAQGLLLIEDLGHDLYADICRDDAGREEALYAAAVDLLAALHRIPPPLALATRAGRDHPIAPYDLAMLRREAGLLASWYLPAALGVPLPPKQETEFLARLDAAMEPALGGGKCLVLRDYHAQNLFWLPERQGLARVGLIDYQDALRGHPAYDLVSLLEDARRDSSAAIREAMIRRYLEASGLEEAGFRGAFAALGAQRNMKIIGIFCRLWLRDGKAVYLDLIPRVWRHLQGDLADPGLAELARWIGAHAPPPDREVLERIRAARS